MLKYLIIVLFFCVPLSSYGSLKCTGNAHHLNWTYIFDKSKGKDLKITRKVVDDTSNEVVVDAKGTAIYTSTVKDDLFGVLESYYYVIDGRNSYTELIGIDPDFKKIARSRPMPNSQGNFAELKCNGKL